MKHWHAPAYSGRNVVFSHLLVRAINKRVASTLSIMPPKHMKRNETRWILLWIDKELFPSLQVQIFSRMQKLKKILLKGKLTVKIPLIDVVEYERNKTTTSEKNDFKSEATKFSDGLKNHSPSEVYRRFSSAEHFTSFVIQVASELYYPMWAPNYIRCFSRFLSNLPGVPEDLKQRLEEKLQLPDYALQHEFSKAMEEKGQYSFNQYFEWARNKYPGIDEDFRRYIAREKPGITTFVEQQEYCVANFGHPGQPTLWVYFPIKAREVLPPPNDHLYAKVIGIICYNPNPPLPQMPTVYLRAACLFGKLGSTTNKSSHVHVHNAFTRNS